MNEHKDNQIIQELININDFSERALKKIYRKLCKLFHPDISKKSDEEFIKLQKDYEEAKNFIEDIKKNKKFFNEKQEYNYNSRLEFYDKLYYYTVTGLHSIKMRLKSNLKERNDKIIEEVIFWAEKYNPLFIPIFNEYNKIYVIPIDMIEVARRIYKAQRTMIRGLYFFFDYQRNGLESYKKIAQSYIEDSIYELNNLGEGDYQKSIINFAEFILKELILPPVCKE